MTTHPSFRQTLRNFTKPKIPCGYAKCRRPFTPSPMDPVFCAQTCRESHAKEQKK